MVTCSYLVAITLLLLGLTLEPTPVHAAQQQALSPQLAERLNRILKRADEDVAWTLQQLADLARRRNRVLYNGIMNRTGHGGLAWPALIAAVLLATLLGGSVLAQGQNRDFDLSGHGCAHAFPPPDLDDLCPVLDDSLVASGPLHENDTPVTDDGYRLPLASRAPPRPA